MKKRIVDIILAMTITATMLAGCASTAVSGSASGSTAVSTTSEEQTDASVSSDDKDGSTSQSTASATYASTSDGGASTTAGVDVDLTGDYSDKALDAEWSENDADAVISFDNNAVDVTGSGASVSGTTVTISDKGTYVIKGTLSDGQIIVDNEDDENVRLILDGVDITCSTDSAIKALNAKNVYITLADGTTNTVTDSRAASDDTDSNTGSDDAGSNDSDVTDAAIYAECDLIINGSGTLNVNGNYNDGIKSKDDLQIISGTINVDAYDDGIIGKDLVSVKDGTITVTCGDDAVKSSEDEDSTKGYIVVDGGSFNLSSDSGHGFNAVFAFVMNDGTVNITKCNEGIQSLNIIQNGGDITINAADDGVNVSDKRASADTGSTATTDTADTGSADTADASAAQTGDAAVTDAIADSADSSDSSATADYMAFGKGSGRGSISGNNMPQMGHGPQMSGGQQGSVSGDSAGGMMGGNGGPGGSGDNGGPGGNGGGNMGGTMENVDGCLVINGGTLTVTASGDGLDSNGDILINGGTVTVIGPTGDGDTAIDKNGVWEQDGGTVYAQSSSGMVEAVDADISSGCYVSTVFSSAVAAGTEITVTDSDGNKVMNFTSKESVPFVYFSSPDLKEGAAYTITAGDQSAEVTEGEMSTGSMGGMH